MLTQELAQFRRNGTFKLFKDESNLPPVTLSTALHTLVGQSRKKDAPINTLVEIATSSELHATFGERSRKDERNGNFFILMAEQLLSAGEPIYMLNLRDYEDDQNATYAGLATASGGANSALATISAKQVFDRSGFWKLLPDSIEVGSTLLSIGNYSGRNLTVYTIQSKIAIEEFGDQTVGEYKAIYPESRITHIHDSVLVRDLFVDVYVFGRDLSNTSAITSPDLLNLVDEFGAVDTSKLATLTAIEESAYIGRFTGSVTPEIVDANGNNVFIETVINASATSTGLFAKINEDILYANADWESDDGLQPYIAGVDNANLTGTTDKVLPAINALSYATLPSADESNDATKLIATMFQSGVEFEVAYAYANAAAFDAGAIANTCAFVDMVAACAYTNSAEDHSVLYTVSNLFMKKDARVIDSNGQVARVKTHTKVGELLDPPELQTLDVVINPNNNEVYGKDVDGDWVYPAGHAEAGDKVRFDSETGRAQEDNGGSDVDIALPTLSNEVRTAINIAYGTLLNVYRSTMDRNVRFDNGGSVTTQTITLQDNSTITIAKGTFTLIRNAEDRLAKFKPVVLAGIELRDTQFVNGTAARQNAILDLLQDSGISAGLKNYEKYPFWFLVDSFKTYVEANAKSQFTTLCQDAKRFAYIGPYPFFSDMEKSTNPLFKSSVGGKLDAKYVVSGGNVELQHSTLYSFPTSAQGDYFGLFVGPELEYNDGFGSVKIPATAGVALLYGANFTIGGRKPYTSVNGSSTGVIGLSNVSVPGYDVTEDQRDILEPAGFNVIQLRTQNGIQTSLQIRSSKSAKTSQRSALSQFENTLLMLFVARETQAMLDIVIDEIPKRNTPEKRQKVLTKARQITNPLIAEGTLERVDHVCDLSNNPAEVRAQGYLVLDTTLYIAGGAKIAVHRLIAKGPVDESAN